jgi:hypothetical protein
MRRRKIPSKKEGPSAASRLSIEVTMEKRDIETLREQVSCGAVLERCSWKVDTKESTRRAVKYRRGDGEIVIVIHEGKGWFDPLSEAKGDVFSLVIHLDDVGFAEALDHVGDLVGFVPSEPAWAGPSSAQGRQPLGTRWMGRPAPRPGSPTWLYLTAIRGIPTSILVEANRQNLLREGPYGSMWAAHINASGAVIGWEQRGLDWRGFATGGAKELFRLGAENPERVCVTEAAIDAMSLAAIEGMPCDTLYVSTGGGWAPAADAAIRGFAVQPGLLLVAATDSNSQGDAYGERIRLIAEAVGGRYARLRPRTEDWNKELAG